MPSLGVRSPWYFTLVLSGKWCVIRGTLMDFRNWDQCAKFFKKPDISDQNIFLNGKPNMLQMGQILHGVSGEAYFNWRVSRGTRMDFRRGDRCA